MQTYVPYFREKIQGEKKEDGVLDHPLANVRDGFMSTITMPSDWVWAWIVTWVLRRETYF